MSFRKPALEGDVTYLDGKVLEKESSSAWGGPIVVLRISMSNQDGDILADGTVEVELPER